MAMRRVMRAPSRELNGLSAFDQLFSQDELEVEPSEKRLDSENDPAADDESDGVPDADMDEAVGAERSTLKNSLSSARGSSLMQRDNSHRYCSRATTSRQKKE